jgi:DNA-binding MarR family transcriptional regulator
MHDLPPVTGRRRQLLGQRALASRLRSTALTSERALVVTALTYYGPLTQSGLDGVLHRHKAAVSALINNMERERFVERTVKPDDNRSNAVSLLPRGTDAFSTVDNLVAEFRARLSRGLSPAVWRIRRRPGDDVVEHGGACQGTGLERRPLTRPCCEACEVRAGCPRGGRSSCCRLEGL